MPMQFEFSPEALRFNDDIHQSLPAKLDALERLCVQDTASGSIQVDALILTSKDPFLSEYVPIANNHRYGATGFSGSVGDAVYWSKNFREHHPDLSQKPISLFVDGRYHLQADRQVPSQWVEVVKLDVQTDIEIAIQKRTMSHEKPKIGMVFERTDVATLQERQTLVSEKLGEVFDVKGPEVLAALNLPGWVTDRKIFSLTAQDTGRPIEIQLTALGQALLDATGSKNALHMTAATDDAAFLLNARGFHLPNTGSFLAYTFFLNGEMIVFLPRASENAPVELTSDEYALTVIRNDWDELKSTLKKIASKENNAGASHIVFRGSVMNGLLPTFAQEVFPNARVVNDFDWLLKARTRKTPEEIESIRKSFQRSSKAIAKMLRWGKEESQKRKLSEVELSEYLSKCYADQGAIAHSFGTISGAGPNSAIVHYSTPSPECWFEAGQLALIDSGVYFEEGFCTDTTRGFFVGGSVLKDQSPEPWQKEIYTATLKAAIQVFIQPIDAKLSGKEVDAKIRSDVRHAGYNYLHGTGHGVGIHVHEEGIRFSTTSTYPQSAYAVVSVEPGIYIEGKGGVRIENIAFLHPEPTETQCQHYRYENLVTVGYDWDLIDLEKLTDAEKTYLKGYELKCRQMGTELMECPL